MTEPKRNRRRGTVEPPKGCGYSSDVLFSGARQCMSIFLDHTRIAEVRGISSESRRQR